MHLWMVREVNQQLSKLLDMGQWVEWRALSTLYSFVHWSGDFIETIILP